MTSAEVLSRMPVRWLHGSTGADDSVAPLPANLTLPRVKRLSEATVGDQLRRS